MIVNLSHWDNCSRRWTATCWVSRSARAPPISLVSTDSRNMEPGALFIPLEGERFDGHAYIDSALEAGAVGCLTARERERYLPGKFYVKVADTQRACGTWRLVQGPVPHPLRGGDGQRGQDHRQGYAGRRAGGQVQGPQDRGQLQQQHRPPLTLLSWTTATRSPWWRWGWTGSGRSTTWPDWCGPTWGSSPNIGDAHIERLGSRENIFQAKCELLPHIKKDGLLILNGDDPLLSTLRGRTPVPAVFCGTGEGMDYRARSPGGTG